MVKLPSPDRLETIRILHVDDEPDLLQITKLYLIEANPAFTIESLSTPNNAMERLEEPFDCVVSDYQMPGMDGIELCRRIKEKHDIPFIIYTGRGSEEVASIAFEAGADDYIRKEAEPSHYQVFARRIEEAVRKHRVERELQRSESRYRKLVELSPFAILTYDFKGFVTSVNRTLLDLTGFSEDELVGKHFTKLGYLHARDIPRYLKIFESLLKGEIPPPVEFPYATKGGEPKRAEAHVAFLEDEENRRIGILSVVRDITDRKRNEDTLDAIFRSGSRLAYLDNREEVYSATLQILHEILGFQTFGIAVQTGQGFRYITSIFDTLSEGFLIPLDQPSVVRRAFNTGVTQLVPDTRLDPDYYTLPDSDGESVRLSDLVVPIIVDGEVVAVIDIESKEANFFTGSYRRFAEILAMHVASAISRLSQLDLLRESEEKYRTLVESSMDAVYVVQEGGIVYTNKVGAELLGYPDPSDVIGIDPLDLVPPEHRGELDERLARTWRGEEDSGRYEMQVLRKDGSSVDIETFSANILYEGKPARLSFDRDITERKKMEEELRRYADRLEELVAEKVSELSESEEMFRTIFVESPIGIEIYDAEGRLLNVNEACLNIFGVPDVNAVRGFKLFEDPNIPEDMKQRLLQRESVRYLASFDFDKVRELGLYDTKKSGTILTDVGITPLSGEGSQDPVGYLVLVQDITEQKRMEEELIDTSKMLAAGSIASMLGHDLRGPLQTIKNSLYLMEKTPETADKSREIISNAVDHALEMLEELRSSTRDTPLQLIETNLGNLFSQVIEDVSVPPQVTLVVDVGEGLERTLLDPAKMRRVLGNLIRNAGEAMPEGGELAVSGEIEGGDVVISVRDTGKGIPVEEMPDLFKPFVTTKSKGMGLGLPYCKRAVEAHGGSISVESEVCVGSMFMVRLPLDPKT